MDRRRWGTVVSIAMALLVIGMALLTPVAQAAAPAAPAQDLLDPSPPGANDWGCRPSPEHPDPVVLVHGLGANQALNWSYVAPRLAERGFCVFALTYGRNPLAPPPLTQVGGLAPMETSAAELGDFVDRVLAATGAGKVDIVGHSEGSLMPNHYVRFLGGAEHVGRYVGMTPLWDGTETAGLALLNRTGQQLGLGPAIGLALDPLCASCRQFLRGSDFLERMNSDGGPRAPGVDYTMILTRYDELVVPYTSGLMDGADNIVLQDGCPTDLAEHVAVAFDPVTLQHIVNALDPEHARPVRCLPVGPEAPTAS
ncbi:alpha/beta fold hydrolase [Pseudonocardia sp. HH130630-07]|uniref:alpha/beta fold hydrolase n=1 Tax=Pseudonocardia sp. HH130630-07 TaxID=1690815 RepID=UPI000815290C|nr:alpha/beta fold hydrolase [Pseudonocardia sp. HH130630-07]ANY09173.1 lipase [Pseudonocardia sp. HH130630-07]